MVSDKHRVLLISLLTFVSFLLGILQFVFSGILDQVAASIGISIATAGQLVTSFSLGSALGTPLLVMLTGRMERKKRLLLSLGTILISTITIAAIPNFAFMIISRVLMGIGFGVYGISAFGIVAEISEEGRLARSMASLSVGSSAALIAGVPVARLITEAYEWQVIFWGIGILMLLVIFFLHKLLPTSADVSPTPVRQQLLQLKNPHILLALCVTFFMFISYSAVNTYAAPYLASELGMENAQISVSLLLLGIASVVGAKLGGSLADRLSPGKTLLIGLLAQAVTLVPLVIIPRVPAAVVGLLTLWALAAWTTGPILNVNLVLVAPSAAAMLLSLNGTFVQLGFAAGAAVGGAVVQVASLRAILWFGIVGIVVAAIIGWRTFRSHISHSHQ